MCFGTWQYNEDENQLNIEDRRGCHLLPQLFPFFESILNLSLSDGARVVVRENVEDVKYLNVNDEGILKDIDTPQDFKSQIH